MEKTMLGHAGFLTAIRESALSGMIDEVKGVEPATGYFLLVEMRTPPRGELVSRQQPPPALADIDGCNFGRSNAYLVIER
jgi:formate dehydrogenase major subunit